MSGINTYFTFTVRRWEIFANTSSYFLKKYNLQVTRPVTILSGSSVLKQAYKSLINSPVQGILSPCLDDALKNLCMQLLGQQKGTTELQMQHVFWKVINERSYKK